MSKNTLVVLIVVVVLALGIGYWLNNRSAQETAQPQVTGVLKVGSDVTYPPFEFVDEKTNEFKGFDVDLINAIGEEMGKKIEIINTAWDGIIPGLLNGNYDALISAMTITEERAQAVNFSDPYFATGQVIVLRADNTTIHGPKDLEGKVVAVQIGTTGDFEASKVKGVKKIARFNTTPEALQEVLNGAADAAVVDELVAREFIKQNPGAVKLADVGVFTVEYYGIAVRKEDEALRKEINRALAAVKASGKYDEIYNKWFGTETTAVKSE